MDWDVLRPNANSRVLLNELHSTNPLKASRSRSDEPPILDSSLKNESAERNFENQFRIWQS